MKQWVVMFLVVLLLNVKFLSCGFQSYAFGIAVFGVISKNSFIIRNYYRVIPKSHHWSKSPSHQESTVETTCHLSMIPSKSCMFSKTWKLRISLKPSVYNSRHLLISRLHSAAPVTTPRLHTHTTLTNFWSKPSSNSTAYVFSKPRATHAPTRELNEW